MNSIDITVAGIINGATGDTIQSALRKVSSNFDSTADHIANQANPHGVTAAQTGAAPLSHVGAGGAAHALATELVAGFMSSADKTSLDQFAAANYLTHNQTISLSGDATGSGATAIALTLAPSGITAGTYNNLVVDAKGRAVSGTQAAYLTANQTISVRGDVSGSGSTVLSLTLTPTGITAGTYTKLVIDASGRAFTGSLLTAQDVQTALSFTPVNAASVGVAGGIATIGANGYLTGSLFPPSISSGMHYVGTWNASSNSPVLTSGTGQAGAIYRVNTAGTSTLDSTSSWYVGDFAVFDGTTWDRWHGASTEVTSVAGRVGTITLAVTDVAGAAPLASPVLSGTPTAPTPASTDSSTALATTAFVTAQSYLTSNQTIVVSGDAAGSGATAIALTLAASGIAAGTYNTLVVDAKGRATSGTRAAYLTSNQTVAISGDASGSGSTAIALTLAASGVVAGTYNSLVVDAKGRAIAGSSVAYLTGNQTITASGDVSGTGSTAIPLTLAATGIAAGTYNSLVVDTKGRASSGTLVPYLTSNQTVTLSGDGTGTGSTAIALTLAASGVAAGTYNTLVVDTKGRAIAGSNTAYLTSNQSISVTGDATGVGTTSISVALVPTGVTAGTYSKVAVDLKGRVVAATLLAAADVITALGSYAVPLASLASTATVATSAGRLTAPIALSLSGDATGAASFDGSSSFTLPLTLAASGITAGTYNTVVVDAKGRATSGANAAYLTGNQTITLTGDVTGTGSTSIPMILATSGVTAGTYAKVSVDAKGRVLTGTLLAASDVIAALGTYAVILASLAASATVATSAAHLTSPVTMTANGDATGSTSFDGSASFALPLTLAASGVTAGTYNTLAVDAKGRAVSGTNTAYLTTNQTITHSGDVTGTGTTLIPMTLAASGVAAGTYNTVVVDAKGRAVAGSNTAYLTSNQAVTVSGDATGSGSTAITLTLAASGATAGTYTKVAVDTKGRVLSGGTLAAADVITALGTYAVPLASLASTATVATTAAQLTNPVTMTASGDATGSTSFTGSSSFTLPLLLAASGIAAGTYNTLVVDVKGRATAGSNAAYLTGNQTVTVTGDATGSGATAIALTLATTGATAGTYTKLAVDTKGRVLSGALLAAQDVLTAIGTYAVPLATQASSASAAAAAARFAAPVSMTISGDASGTASFDGSASFIVPVSLAASGVVAGTYNTVVVDAKGRATSGSNAAYLTGNQTITTSGDVTGTGSTLIPMTLAASGVTAGSYTHFSVDVKGRIISARSINASDVTTALGYTPISNVVLSGDVFGSATTGTLVATLSNSGVTAGTYNTVVVDAKGRATSGANAAYLSSNQVVTVSGDATGSGNTAIALTLAASGVTPGTYSAVVVDAKGRVIASAQGVSNPIRAYDFNAGSFDAPNSSDWAVNMLAPATSDPNNSGLVVRSFDPSTEAGVGMSIRVPQVAATQVTFRYLVRAATAAASASVAGIVMNCYSRIIPSGAAIGAWGSYVMAAQSVSTNIYYHEFVETALLTTIGWSAGTVYQLELTRNAAASADTLTSALYLHKIVVEFS